MAPVPAELRLRLLGILADQAWHPVAELVAEVAVHLRREVAARYAVPSPSAPAPAPEQAVWTGNYRLVFHHLMALDGVEYSDSEGKHR